MTASPQTRFPNVVIWTPGRASAGSGAGPGQRTLARIPALRVRLALSCLLVIGVADLVIWRWKGAPYAVEGLLDEPAHAATGLLALAALAGGFQAPLVLAVLAGSLLIDADHIPHVFGSDVLEHGIPRPYTHSFGTILVLGAIILLLRNRNNRRLLLIVTSALALHFFRDSAEPGGPGVSLLWPVSDHGVTIAYGWYAGVLAGLAAIALGRARLEKGPGDVDHSLSG